MYRLLIGVLLCSYGSVSGRTLSFSDKVLEHFGESGGLSLRVNPKCRADIAKYLEGLEKTELWAVKMLDATTKLHSGILEGNTVDLGNFDQCVNVRHDSESTGVIQGQHCLVYGTFGPSPRPHLNPYFKQTPQFDPEKMSKEMASSFFGLNHFSGYSNITGQLKFISFGFAACVPASCSPEEIRNEMKEVLKSFNLTIDTYNADRVCNIQEEIRFNRTDKIALSLLGVVAILMVFSTSYDMYLRHSSKGNESRYPVLLSFSVITNGKRLTNVEHSGHNVMLCLNGIRVLSTFGIILGHRVAISNALPHSNELYSVKMIQSYPVMLIFGAMFTVDTFLVITGLLVSYSYIKFAQKGFINPLAMYLHRYLRMAPPLAVMVLFQASLAYYLGSGPFWKQVVGVERENCVNWWWTTMTFTHNYRNSLTPCMVQTWTLCLDMQLFLLSPFLLYFLRRYTKKSILFIVMLIAAIMANSFVMGYKKNLHVSNYIEHQKVLEFIKNAYLPTHVRADPWFVGILLGFVIHKVQGVNVHISKVKVAIAWVLSLSIMSLIVYGAYLSFHDPRHVPQPGQDALGFAVGRSIWAVCMGWVIFACSCGYGGFLNRVLSHRYWLPFSRLSYSFYLTHFLVQTVISSSTRSPLVWSGLNFLGEFAIDVIAVLFVSTIFYMAIEAPVANLLYHIRSGKTKSGDENHAELKKAQ